MTKTCSKCLKTKDISVFYKKTAYRPKDDGYDYYCKACRNIASKNTWNGNKIKCTKEGCDSPNYARHLCKCHYHKLLRREKKNK